MEPKLVYNERLKALAGAFHNLAVAAISGGVLLPVIAANLTDKPHFGYFTTIPIGILLALSFGAIGQMILGSLQE